MTSNDDKFKKVTLNIPMLDNIMSQGIPQGKIYTLGGHCGLPKTNLIRFIPIEKSNGNYMVTMSLEMGDEVTKKGIEIMQKMLDKMKDYGVDISEILENSDKTITQHERIGDTIFPVNYHPNGMVTVDYPYQPFCEQLRKKHFGDDKV